MMGDRLTYFGVDHAKSENRKLHRGRPIIGTGGGGGRNNKKRQKINDRDLLACKKKGENLKFVTGKLKSFGIADVIFRLTILRGGRVKECKKNAVRWNASNSGHT
jgi:hypothetical protein